ncbi:Alpha/Beta hydrolase protein [Radiomyces spectabilis]|uniref:Alpha/Beta hydrolase protein n=1 Tax=Radiomyces spectabilis TaxID=64574 RepID=UPI00221F918A|nr:Alpha/Beta hydrolase protein [Radiomyces spectabilis]KAI8374321.1 Alpha/Beta hydrolase protein [Radiomyces spectabilis]
MFVRARCIALPLFRHYTTASVSLAYTKYPVKEPVGKPPLVVCHGLFGSKQNWKSLAKAMSRRLSRDIYTLDLRNHGDSPHSNVHTYEAMANDLVEFIRQHNLGSPALLGHSMGGKVVMTAALRYPKLVSRLIVADIAPAHMKLSRDFDEHIEAMRAIDDAGLEKHKEADAILARYEPDLGVRQFLLTNFKRQPEGHYQFRVPYDILASALGNMGEFLIDEAQYSGPTRFILGGNSPYRKPFIDNPDLPKARFPNADVKVIEGAGHWVHAEKPDAFLHLVADFMNNH